MTQHLPPFAIARPLGGKLDALLTYWQNLRRGAAEIPFSDDLSLPEAQNICRQIFLLDVFAKPERFRLSSAEIGLDPSEQGRVLGHFIDDVDLPPAFDLLRAQCSATVELSRPTVYRHEPAEGGQESYQRLLLPAWGEGQVKVLLGAIEHG